MHIYIYNLDRNHIDMSLLTQVFECKMNLLTRPSLRILITSIIENSIIGTSGCKLLTKLTLPSI